MNSFTSESFIVFCIFLFFASTTVNAQELERSVCSSGGKSATAGSLSLDYNLGEVIVFTGFTSDVILAQGFEQSDLLVTTGDFGGDFMENMSAYPNPVKNQLTIYCSKAVNVAEIKVELWDVFGKKTEISNIHSASLFDQYFSFDLSNYTSGVYFVTVFSLSKNVSQTLKIIKL